MVGGLLELDDDLAEVAARFLEPEGVSDFGQGKGAVDHRFNLDGVDAGDQVPLMPAAADVKALKALLPRQEHGGRSRIAGVREVNQRQTI